MVGHKFKLLLGVVVASAAIPASDVKAQSLQAAVFTDVAPPNGASAHLTIPAALMDGSYPTPNQHLSDAAAAWHFRVAMNVAALGCRGPEAEPIIAAYNAMLIGRKAELAVAERAVSAEFSANTSGRQAYDDAMTRLYNFFAQPPAQSAFCAAAAQAMAGEANVPAGQLAAYARTSLAALDQPFTDFYQAYGAWQSRRAATPVAAVTIAAVAPVPAVVKAAPHTPLQLDLSDLVPETAGP